MGNNVIALGHYGAVGDISGVTTWVVALIDALHSKQIPISVLVPHFGPSLEDCSIFQSVRTQTACIKGVQVPFETEAFARWTLEQLNDLKPAVFLPQCLPALHYAASISATNGIPWVFTLHSDAPDYWALAELVGPNANAGTWVAVSEHIADKARKLNPAADIRIIPYGVPVEARNARWNNSVFRIAYCGRMLEEQKRIKLVTTTLIECCRMSSNIEAVMIGDGPERDAMEHRIEKEGLSERIRFTGRLAGANLQNTLSSCQGILLMSDYEGLPVALLEGMAQGLVPMARSMQSGIPELVIPNQTGLILPDTPRNAAEPIVKLARDPVAWQGMSECAYALVREKYSQRTCLEQWLSLIQELSQRSTASYPIEIPSRIKLPPSDRRLRAHDWRRLTFLQKIGFQLKRLVRRIKIPN